MANAFASKPELDENFPAVEPFWTCPITGLVVPKDPDANLRWRARLLRQAEEDKGLQVDLYTACSKSLLFFVNFAVFTLRVFEPNAADDGRVRQAVNKHLPMVTWPIQDRHLLALERAIVEGRELLTDKSRDMGATWNHVVVYTHRLLFRASESHLMISRKEDAVDVLDGAPKNYPHGALADPGTLFGKIDYVLSRLPEWMLPKLSRKKMHLVNLSNRTRIDGESANATAGSSDRRTSILLDEMAKMKEGESIKRSTRDVTACRLPCSTPNGAGTAYSKWRMSGQIEVFVLPWWEHPEKGAGRYVAQDELGRWKIRSPWYDAEAAVRSPKEMAIEIDMDHVGSGDLFFESSIIEEHRKLFAKKPLRSLTVKFAKDVPDSAIPDILARKDRKKLVVMPRGPVKVWVRLDRGRLDQSRTYTVACDISKGQGASNSTISVICNETREKVAAYADAHTPPYEFAKLVCALCLWVGGRNGRPLLIWENNGDPGFDFGNQIVKTFQYPNIYFDRRPGTRHEKAGKRYGWRSSPEKKAMALGQLRRAYARGTFINHDEAALNEALTYVHFENGGIGPADLVAESDAVRKAHGDRVIADMLAVVGSERPPKAREVRHEAPRGSIGQRLAAFQREKKRAKKADRFDFRV